MKKLSIITVNYNDRSGLAKTFSSVSALGYQIRKQIEFIVVDGLSNDGSIEFLRKRAEVTDKFSIESDESLYDAMNKGVSMATGEYVYFLNSGDELLPETFHEVLPYLKGSDIVYGNVNIVYRKHAKKFVAQHRFLTHRMSISHQGTFVKRKLQEDIPFDLRFKLAGDFHFFNKCLKEKRDFKKIDITLANFIAGGRSNQLFFSCRTENLKALIYNKQIRWIPVAVLRYIREFLHLCIIKVVS